MNLRYFIILQAVEKVLAGAIRREMALEEYSAKQTSEIMHLNRLVGFIHVMNRPTIEPWNVLFLF